MLEQKRQRYKPHVNQYERTRQQTIPHFVLIKEQNGFKSFAVDAPCGNPEEL